MRLERAAARVDGRRVGASVVAVDHFGNLALDLRPRRAGSGPGWPSATRWRCGSGARAHRLVVAETFASVPAGELVLHEDSFGSLAVAVNLGRAADRLGAGPGDQVEIVRAAGEA